ncbi:glucuronate isomerase [Halegenticoccus tardaugens]|uniref:glucuronate isomerase n=1 Tax=Halegenticoccus tardaugens TaxID=2071624 RepID=UPI00100B2E3F|nr:glucuronate isomerase [Halegenticoccus tardaugens]
MGFISDEYLLETDAARDLYQAIEGLPIVDPHTHADVTEIVENEGWNDIWEVEGATDHYVWALMRNRGVDEELITGSASNRKKWNALTEVFPDFAGNPTYEWIHLDLKRRFGIDELISSETADDIWEETSTQLETSEMRPQAVLEEMNVEVICSTDDPTSSLHYHERAADEVSGVEILPTWRIDRAMTITQPDWNGFVDELNQATGIDTTDLKGFLDALAATHDYFANRGCVASDLGIQEPVSRSVKTARAREIYRKAFEGGSLDEQEVTDFQAYLLEYAGELNAEKGWVTQLHIGPVRNYRQALYDRLGPAAGGDVSTQRLDVAENLEYFLNRFDGDLEVVLYSLDPTHYPTLATLSRVFPNVSVGPAWWFNDSPYGIEEQLEYTGTVGLIANYAGMVSDSRKLLSYGSRFEMFRRSLANVVGRQLGRGQIPKGPAYDLIEHIAYDRPKELFGI